MSGRPPAGSIADSELERRLTAAALDAARLVAEAFDAGVEVERKADGSPVTKTDRAAEDLILERLAEAAPGVPVVAEERVSRQGPPAELGDAFFLVDALDGTADFIKGGDSAHAFTVNIALIENGAPTFGVVAAPKQNRIWVGRAGAGAWTAAVGADGVASPEAVHVADPSDHGIIALVSSRADERIEAVLAAYDVAERRPMGSSLKYCLIAEGRADLHPRFTPTSQWDTAAGDAVLRAAGGRVVTMDGALLAYGGRTPSGAMTENPPLVALGGVAFRPPAS